MENEKLEGVILKGVGGLYYARTDAGETHVLRAKGKFRRQRISPLVGDRVLLTPGEGDEHGWVEEIRPRSSVMVRPPVANVDSMFLVLAPVPEPDYLLLDMLLATAQSQQVRAVLVVNKCDLDAGMAERVRRMYRGTGAEVFAVSAQTGEGTDALKQRMQHGLGCFAGQSGVGKSTLLSGILGLELETGEISQRISRGKNTTRHAELLTGEELQVLDTAGFSLLELWEGLEPVQLKAYYPEFAAYEGTCRFSPCYHRSEPGCAVLEAAANGEIDRERLDRYHVLLEKVEKAWRERYE